MGCQAEINSILFFCHMNQSISVPYRMKIQSYSQIDSCLSLCSNTAQLACDQSGKWTSLAEMEHKEDMNKFSCNFGFSFCMLWRCCSGTYDRKIGVGVTGPIVGTTPNLIFPFEIIFALFLTKH